VSRVRSVLRALGAPFRWTLLGAIAGYRATLSGWLGGQCRFYPSCSAYASEAIRTHGAGGGSVLAVWRILRCNPFGRGGIDPVPPARAYDDVVRQAGDERGDAVAGASSA
jgi:putative membrane protein insertion efficiency factor